MQPAQPGPRFVGGEEGQATSQGSLGPKCAESGYFYPRAPILPSRSCNAPSWGQRDPARIWAETQVKTGGGC